MMYAGDSPAEYILFKFLKYQYVLSTMCHDDSDVLKYVTVPGPAAAPWHWDTGSTSLPG